MNPNDTTTYKIMLLQDSSSTDSEVYKIEIISKGKDDASLLANPIFTSFAFPILITLVTFFITRYVTRKKERTELSKLEAETEKNKAEIEQIRTSFQPIIVSSLQTIQNKVFENKIDSLKGLINSKNELFEVDQMYHEGDAFIEDAHEYYENVYWNVSAPVLQKIKMNSLNNGSLFPNSIRIKFQDLVGSLYEIRDVQEREYSLKNQAIPDGVQNNLEVVSDKFDELIDEIRHDLHLDNTFIHDFISEHQKLKNKDK